MCGIVAEDLRRLISAAVCEWMSFFIMGEITAVS